MFFKYTINKMAKEFLKAANLHGFNGVFDSDELTIEFSDNDGERGPMLFLPNLFNKVKDLAKSERQRIITSTVEELFAPAKELSAEEVVDGLCLRARTPFEMHLRRKSLGARDESIEFITYGEPSDAFLELVFDSEETVRNVQASDLELAELSKDDAYQVAQARLARETDSSQWQEIAPSIWQSNYHDDYDFARILSAGSDASFPFSDKVVLYAPSHSVCLITNAADDVNVLQQLLTFGEQLAENHRPFSQYLWQQSNDAWAPVRNSPNQECAELLVKQYEMEQLNAHNEQKRFLEQELETQGVDAFVASYQVYNTDDGIQSMSVYTVNLPTYLPRTDLVAIVDVDDSTEDSAMLGTMAWPEFANSIGDDLVEHDSEFPPRYTLMKRLSEQQLDGLRSNAS